MSENRLDANKVVKHDIPRTQEYWENRPEVYLMRYSEFADEYKESMAIAKTKESKGHLDPHHPNYIPMTTEEQVLHARDWRAFSKHRGFTDFDIAEYARWHKISGQTDNLENAMNDPWRRPSLVNWDKQLYVQHIAQALNSGIKIPSEIIKDFEMIKTELEAPFYLHAPPTPEPNNSTGVDFSWDDESW